MVPHAFRVSPCSLSFVWPAPDKCDVVSSLRRCRGGCSASYGELSADERRIVSVRGSHVRLPIGRTVLAIVLLPYACGANGVGTRTQCPPAGICNRRGDALWTKHGLARWTISPRLC